MKYNFSLFSLGNYFVLALLSFCTIYPFIYILVYSLNDGLDAMKGGLHFWPRKFTLQNYTDIFKDSTILVSYRITIFRTLLGTVLHVALTMLAAYSLSKKTMPGRNLFTFFIFIPTIFSSGFIPFFILLQELQLYNTFWVYIIPFLYNFFHIIIVRTFLEQLPPELIESARIDGYGELRIFVHIIVPLSGPVIAVIAIFIGVFHWNDWFTGAYYVSDPNLIPVQTLLHELLTRSEALLRAATRGESAGGGTTDLSMNVATSTPESLRMAVLAIATVPILCIYPFFQKHFVKGALLGSVKG